MPAYRSKHILDRDFNPGILLIMNISEKSTVSDLRRKLIATTVSVVALTGAYMLGQSPIANDWFASANAATAAPATIRTTLSASRQDLPNFADIVAQQGPAVVNISVTGSRKASGPAGFPQLDPDDPFYEFFRRFQGPRGQSPFGQHGPRNRIPIQGQGSGFIVSADGYVLTNAHVVADAEEVTVKLIDKREFKAKVVGVDRPTDIAVLKIDAKNLPAVKIGSAEASRVGDWVLAIGAPFGFENSVTAGIVSAKSRSLPDEGYVPFLQTDVAINPGNSGGPLFNMQGEVIGINSQIYSRSGGYQGLSFAIPIDVAMNVQSQLINHGQVKRGRIGVTIQEMNQDLSDSFGLDKPHGALVSAVEKGGPAQLAGVEPGDVILSFNGQAIERSGDLPPLVSRQPPGSKAKLSVWRRGKTKELSLTLAAVPNQAAEERAAQAESGKLGLSVRPLNPAEQRQAEVSHGLLVEDVANGPAARAGIQPGDIILSVNNEPVKDIAGLRKAFAGQQKQVALQIQRGDSRLFVPVRLR